MIRQSFWLLLLPLLFLLSCAQPVNQQGQGKENIPVPPLKRMSQEQYGINVGSHQIIQDSFPENQLLVDVLQTFGVERSVIDTIDSRAAAGFDVRNMRAGHPYTILRSTESDDVEFFIYEETDENFVVIDLRDGVNISRGNQPVTTETKSVYLPIITSLYESTRDKGVDVTLVKSLESIFANQVDFRHLDVGDFCKVVFEERYVDGALIGLGQVHAAEFRQGKNIYQAFLQQVNDSVSMYFDQYGENLATAFLSSPVDSLDVETIEFYPNTGFYKILTTETHLPVLAVSSGTITQIDSSAFHGLQLSLSYSDVSRFQYRGLSEITSLIIEGAHVTQGDTLGYTGVFSSGENGVEITYWNRGEKVNQLRDSHASPIISYPEDQAEFQKVQKRMTRLLNRINQGLI